MSQDIGDIGPEKGAVVNYEWPIYRHFASLLPALVVLALMLRKTNRSTKAWLIVLPILIVLAIFYLPIAALSFLSGGGSPFGGLSWMLGLAAVWLIGDRLAQIRGRWAIVVALLVISAFSFAEGLMQGAEPGTLPFIVVPSAIPVLALTLAAYWCRKRFSGPRYIGMLACACATVVLAAALVSVTYFLFRANGFRASFLLSIAIGVPMACAIGALVVFVFLLPFVLLSLKCGFYRQRFVAALRLPAAPEPPAVPAEHTNT